MSGFKVVTICGSMRFYPQMLEAAQDLSRRGYIVLMPHVRIAPEEQLTSELKEMLDEMHFAKIDLADEVVIVTDGTGYYGASSRREMKYAGPKFKGIMQIGEAVDGG